MFIQLRQHSRFWPYQAAFLVNGRYFVCCLKVPTARAHEDAIKKKLALGEVRTQKPGLLFAPRRQLVIVALAQRSAVKGSLAVSHHHQDAHGNASQLMRQSRVG
jgi:hypothetical protein